MFRQQRKSQTQFLLATLLPLLIVTTTFPPFCQAGRTSLTGELSELRMGDTLVYLSSGENQRTRVEKFMATYKNPTDKHKIQYLIESVRISHYIFIRNGKEYRGVQAADWLRWKMHHKQFHSNPILKPQDFIEKVASQSVQSGQEYQVKLDSKTKLPLGRVLWNEYRALEMELFLRQNHGSSEPIPAKNPVSISDSTRNQSAIDSAIKSPLPVPSAS